MNPAILLASVRSLHWCVLALACGCALPASAAQDRYHELRIYTVTSNKMDGVEFHADPKWWRVEQETEKDGKLRGAVEAFKLMPTDFSAIR